MSKSDRYNLAFEPSMYKPEWVAKSPSQRNITGTIKIMLNHDLPFLSGEGRDFFFSEYICLKEFEKLQQISSTSTSLIVLVNSTSTSLTRNILFDNSWSAGNTDILANTNLQQGTEELWI